jgi:hypothetical protein
MIIYLCLCQELSYCCVVCHYLRPKMVWTVWFQLVILSIVALFIIVMWDKSSYMDCFMFYGLTCLSFFRYRSYGFRSLSMYFSIDYYRFRNYRNIGAVFVSDNIVSISFSRKNSENESDLVSYRLFQIVFILDVFDSVLEMYERVFRPEARTPILSDESSPYFLSSTRCDETVDHPWSELCRSFLQHELCRGSKACGLRTFAQEHWLNSIWIWYHHVDDYLL